MRLLYPERTLLLVCGMPGSGKSEMLKKSRLVGNVVVLQADALRGEVQEERGLPFHGWFPECIPEARERFFFYLHKAFERGESVVCEAAYVREHAREEMVGLVRENGYAAHMLLVTASIGECLSAMGKRERSLGFTDMIRYWHQYKAFRAEIVSGVPNDCDGLVQVERGCNLDELVFS